MPAKIDCPDIRICKPVWRLLISIKVPRILAIVVGWKNHASDLSPGPLKFDRVPGKAMAILTA